jgi:hypothetical protein
VTASTPTTIQGVSIRSRQDKGGGDDVFELVLSHEGIEVRRPERSVQHLSWDRVSEWEIEEREGYVLLTLRGQGATTPLVVPGWTLDDLEVLMREVTSDTAGPGPPAAPTPATSNSGETAPAPEGEAPAPAPPTRTERRQHTGGGARRHRPSWRAVVTVLLLGVLATAVIVVLLQSAGVIDWTFLGPVA